MHSLSAVICLLSTFCVASAYQIEPVSYSVIMAESPFWDNETNTVIYVDIIGKKVLRYDPANPDDVKYIQFTEARVSPAVPIAGTSSLLVGVGTSLMLVDVDWGSVGENATLKSSTVLTTVDYDQPGNRFNDGKADPAGRMWIGTMDDGKTSRRRRRADSGAYRGSLYRFTLIEDESGDLTVETERVLTHMQIPNGMVWSGEEDDGNRIYYLADSGEGCIYSYEFNVTSGTLSGRQVVFNFTASNVTGVPDGMTMDIEGNLWVACVHGAKVIRVNPSTGEILLEVPLKVHSVSAAEWGGPLRDILYVTTSKYECDSEDLLYAAGSMFAITDLGTRGRLEVPFRVQRRVRSSGNELSATVFGFMLPAILSVMRIKSS